MSTIYTIAAQSVLASAAATDQILIHSSTEGRVARAALSVIRTYTLTASTVVATTAAVSTTGTATVWGFSTSTQANAIVQLLNALR